MFAIPIEGGLNLVATRRIVRATSAASKAAGVREAIAARGYLAGGVAIATLLIVFTYAFLPVTRWDTNVTPPSVILAGLILGVLLGSNYVWFYQATNALMQHAVIEVSGRLLSLVSAIAFTILTGTWIGPVLGIALGNCLVVGIGVLAARRFSGTVDPHSTEPTEPRQLIREAVPLITSRVLIAGYNSGIPLLLGAISGTSILGGYYLADRPIRALVGLLGPALRSLYSHAVSDAKHVQSGNASEMPITRRIAASSAAVVGAGLAASTTVFLLSETIISLLAGQDFAHARSAVASLRILSVVPLLASINSVLVMLYLLPRGEDRGYRSAVSASFVGALISAYPLISVYGAPGAALAIVVAEGINAVLLASRAFRAAV